LIKELISIQPGEVMMADITYLKCGDGYCYLSLLTDVGSHKILGYHLSKGLSSVGCQKALQMALRQLGDAAGVIHHSDRGVQYCCEDYITILKKHDMKISMTGENHVYENALAERVNGNLKDEFFLGEWLPSFEIARKMVEEAVRIYNNERYYMSLNYMTPAQIFAA
jgi:putative transposase